MTIHRAEIIATTGTIIDRGGRRQHMLTRPEQVNLDEVRLAAQHFLWFRQIGVPARAWKLGNRSSRRQQLWSR
jgi:hypothetical protein